MGGWHRRFRKNNFMAWKFLTKTIVSGCSNKLALIRVSLLAQTFAEWATLPHMSAQEKREMELAKEVATAKQQAAADIAAQVAAAAAQLEVSQQKLYAAEQDKEEIRASASKQRDSLVMEKDKQLLALQQELLQAEERLKRELSAAEQKAESERQILLTNITQTSEKMSKMESDFAAQLASKYSDSQLVDEVKRVKASIIAENDTKVSVLIKKHEAALTSLSSKHTDEIQNLMRQHKELSNKQKSDLVAAQAAQMQDRKKVIC
jgi:hypothetical protein